MNSHFQKEIEKLKKKILTQCAIVEENLSTAVSAVFERDEEAARTVIANDNIIDHNEIEIEEECLKLLALYQPVAGDLRYVVACLKVNNDIERIGDLCCNIAERALALCEHDETTAGAINFDAITDKTQKMLNDALDALFKIDTRIALEVIRRDDEVDDLNRAIHDQVMALTMRDPAHAAIFVSQLSVSKQLERIADYATNICEDVIYMATGNIVRHAGPECEPPLES